MIIKQLFKCLMLFALVPFQVSGQGSREPKWFDGNRIVRSISVEYDHSTEEIFPLLCPVREYEWMASWKGTIVYTKSGLAEPYAVFYHGIPFPLMFKKAYWTATQYIPCKFIQWSITVPGVCIIVIDEKFVNLDGGRTRIENQYHITGLTNTGNRIIEKMFSEDNLMKEQIRTRDEVEHYLSTGEMLGTEYKSDMFN